MNTITLVLPVAIVCLIVKSQDGAATGSVMVGIGVATISG